MLQGHSVTLYEPGARGGVIRTLLKDGFTLEQGPNVLLGKPEILALLDSLGIQNQIVYPRVRKYRQMVWWNGGPHEVPKGPLALIRTPLIQTKYKWRLPLKVLRAGAVTVGSGPDGVGDCSIGSFVDQLIGPEGTRGIADPALKGVYGGDIYRLSLRTLLPELYARLSTGGSVYDRSRSRAGRQIFLLRGGMKTLVEALWQKLENQIVYRPEMVQEVRGLGSEFEVVAGREVATYDQVHITTSGARTAELVRGIAPELSAVLERLQYAPLAFVHFAVPRAAPIPRDCFGIMFGGDRPSGLLGVMFNSELFPHLAPDRYHLLTLCVGGVGREPLVDRPDSEHVRWLSQELRELLKIEHASPLGVQRWPRAIPQLGVGHYRVEEQFHYTEQRNPGLCFLGVDRGGVGVPDRIRIAAV
jgi:oxygen-dependent protoporphyrinogen oxidase